MNDEVERIEKDVHRFTRTKIDSLCSRVRKLARFHVRHDSGSIDGSEDTSIVERDFTR